MGKRGGKDREDESGRAAPVTEVDDYGRPYTLATNGRYGRGASGTGSGDGGWPGRRTLTERLPLPRRRPAAAAGGLRLVAGPGPELVRQIAAEGVAGPGAELPGRAGLEASLGRPVDARAHTDEKAQAACRDLGAEAFTFGDDIAFGSDSPSPALVGHEAAHVVQQQSGAKLAGGLGQEGDAFELEADQVGARVARGESAADLLAGYPSAGAASSGTAVQRKALGPSIEPEASHPSSAPAGAPPADPMALFQRIQVLRATLHGELRVMLSGFRNAAGAAEFLEVSDFATHIAAIWQATIVDYDRMNRLAGERERAPQHSPHVFDSEWLKFKAEVDQTADTLAAGVSPATLMGASAAAVPRPPLGGLSAYVLREAQAVRDLLFTALEVETLLKQNQEANARREAQALTRVLQHNKGAEAGDAKELAGGQVAQRKFQAAQLVENWRGRPANFTFLTHVLKRKGLWSQISAQLGESGRTLNDTGQLVDAHAKDYGAATNVGALSADSDNGLLVQASHHPGQTFAEIMSASPDGREAILRKLEREPLLFDQAMGAGTWRQVQDLANSLRDPVLKQRLRPFYAYEAGGNRTPTLSDGLSAVTHGLEAGGRWLGGEGSYAEAWGHNLGRGIHLGLDGLTGGFIGRHDAALGAREDGRISPEQQSDATARALVISLASVAAGAGAGQLGAAAGQGIAGSLGMGAGSAGEIIAGGSLGGAFGGAGGLLGADLGGIATGEQNGLSPLSHYGQAFGLGGIIGLGVSTVSVAAGRFLPPASQTSAHKLAAKFPELTDVLERARQASSGAGQSGNVTIEMTVGKLRELAAKTGQSVDRWLGGSSVLEPQPAMAGGAPPLSPASLGDDAIVSVTLEARGVFDGADGSIRVRDVREGRLSGRERAALGERSPEVDAMQVFEEMPDGRIVPVEIDPKTGVRKGHWEGQRGNSDFYSYDPDVLAVTKGRAVPYRNGRIDLSSWSQEDVWLREFTNRKADFRVGDEILARKRGWFKPDGTPDVPRAEAFRSDEWLTWHHGPDGHTMELVPRPLHAKLSHTADYSSNATGSGR